MLLWRPTLFKKKKKKIQCLCLLIQCHNQKPYCLLLTVRIWYWSCIFKETFPDIPSSRLKCSSGKTWACLLLWTRYRKLSWVVSVLAGHGSQAPFPISVNSADVKASPHQLTAHLIACYTSNLAVHIYGTLFKMLRHAYSSCFLCKLLYDPPLLQLLLFRLYLT